MNHKEVDWQRSAFKKGLHLYVDKFFDWISACSDDWLRSVDCLIEVSRG